MMRTLLLLIPSLAFSQSSLSFMSITTLYLRLTEAQIASIDANNATYTAAQSADGRRVFDLNRQISDEIRKEEPDAGVISAAYAEIESICRRRLPAYSALIERNQAVLTAPQRTQLQALRYLHLRERFAERAAWMLLSPPPSTASAPNALVTLYGGTPVQATGIPSDLRPYGIREFFEALGLSEEQGSAIRSRISELQLEQAPQLTRLYDLSEEIQRGLAGGSDVGGAVVEIEKLRRSISTRTAEVREANRATMTEAQRQRLTQLLTTPATLNFLFEMEAQAAFLLPSDDPSPDRPATFAGVVTVLSAQVPAAPVVSIRIYPNGSRLLEPVFATRGCIAGPE